MYWLWETSDVPWDDADTKKIKAYRRKSNYYEEKSEALDKCYQNIKKQLDTMDSYGITRSGVTTDSNDVMKYRYYNAQKRLLEGTNQKVDHLDEQLRKVKNIQEEAEELYHRYHRLAEEG